MSPSAEDENETEEIFLENNFLTNIHSRRQTISCLLASVHFSFSIFAFESVSWEKFLGDLLKFDVGERLHQ